MRFFDWLFNRNQEEFITELPITVLNRWFLYDTGMGHENEMAEAIGLTPVSDEGDSKEREDSDARVENVAYLLPFLDHISTLTAETVAHSQKELMIEDGLNPEEVGRDLEVVKKVYKAIALSGMLASFSIAAELSFIHTHPEVFVDSEEGEDPFEF